MEEAKDPLQRLRTLVANSAFDGWRKAIRLCDEMEARYIELPTDADGLPVAVGDYMELAETRGEVTGLRLIHPTDGYGAWDMRIDGDWYATVNARHSEPDTLEAILEDVRRDARAYADANDWHSWACACLVYAERIRRWADAQGD